MNGLGLPWQDSGMRVTQQVVVFDAADLGAESAFWAGLVDGTVEPHEHYHAVNVDGEMRAAVQLAPDHVPPQWPDGAPQQIHLDLVIDDIAAAEAEVLRLGATLLQAATDLQAGSGYRVYADPAGHPFCLCWG
jgi:predicted enzyme related to lactoylglutathione lyase